MRLRSPVDVSLLLVFLAIGSVAYSGVSKEMETYYTQTYLNKAIFLKVPVRGDRQTVYVLERGSSLDQSSLGEPLRFKVGEQVRITGLSFKDSSIEFRVSSLDTARKGTVIFRFRNPLRHSFVSRPSFDAALEDSFTEGLSYQETAKSLGIPVGTVMSRLCRARHSLIDRLGLEYG
ncbi:MAG: sigma factor-like helix-turn-helix DNA-binding protein [bacterium]